MIASDDKVGPHFKLPHDVLQAVKVGAIVFDAELRVVLWNRWMEQHTQWLASAMLGQGFDVLFPEMVGGRTHNAIKAALQHKFSSVISQTLNKAPFPLFAKDSGTPANGVTHKQRIQQAVQVIPIEVQPGTRYCLVQITDVSIAVAREQQLRKQALELQTQIFIDGLTGIANRRRFDDHLENEFRRAKRAASPLSLIMIDVDSFKNFNDNYGHQKGDACLSKIAAALARMIGRPCDLLARYGGEEFAAILPDTDADGARDLAERLRREISDMNIAHAYSEVAPKVTISLGVATQVPVHNSTIANLIGIADAALYRAKRAGRNRVIVHDGGMNAVA